MIIDEDKCVGCGTCVPYCTVNAISLIDGKARIDPDECVECYTCYRLWVCPEGKQSNQPSLTGPGPFETLSAMWWEPTR